MSVFSLYFSEDLKQAIVKKKVKGFFFTEF